MNLKSKRIIVVILLIVLVFMLFAWYIIQNKKEVLRMSVGEGLEYYFVLYENGDLIIETGLTAHSDISKKEYISKEKVVGVEVYKREKVKLSAEDVERVKQLAKALEYCPNDTDPVFDRVRAKFYYSGRSITINNLSKYPLVEELAIELIALSPLDLDLKQLAPA